MMYISLPMSPLRQMSSPGPKNIGLSLVTYEQRKRERMLHFRSTSACRSDQFDEKIGFAIIEELHLFQRLQMNLDGEILA